MSFSARYVPAVLFTLFSLAVHAVCSIYQHRKPPRRREVQSRGESRLKTKAPRGVAVSLRKSE